MTVELATRGTVQGIRLLSHRPSVLYKFAHLATGPSDGDIATDGLVLSGPSWADSLKALLDSLSRIERSALFAVRLDAEHALPLPADTVLARERTDWFPKFLSEGRMVPHFQPIVDLRDGRTIGREALMRGQLGATEVGGGELVAAAEVHDALFSFDSRARMAALEVGLPLLPTGEVLFVNIDPWAVLDVEASIRSLWTAAARLGAAPASICLELVNPERTGDIGLLSAIVDGNRERGALISLDDLSGGARALACLEALRPDVAKLDRAVTAGIEGSRAKRRLVAAIVELAHEQRCKVVAEGVERTAEFEVMRELGVDFGQGYLFGHPTPRPMAVDTTIFRPRVALV